MHLHARAQKHVSKPKPERPLAAARWILIVGGTLLLGVMALTEISDRSHRRSTDTTTSGTDTTTSSPHSRVTDSVAPLVGEVAPWEAARLELQPSLPPGAVAASEINPPPPDPNQPPPPPPIEPPNPATHYPPVN